MRTLVLYETPFLAPVMNRPIKAVRFPVLSSWFKPVKESLKYRTDEDPTEVVKISSGAWFLDVLWKS